MVENPPQADCGGRSREGHIMKQALLALMALATLAAPCLGQDTPPAAPTDLTVVAVSQTSVQLAWTDNSSDEAAFLVVRCYDNGCSEGGDWFITDAGATSFVDSGLWPGTYYMFVVYAERGGLFSN